MRDGEDLAPHSIYADPQGGHVAAFLKAQPEWWQHGLWRFISPLARAGELDLYVFSRAADRAFIRWIRTGGVTYAHSRVTAALE